MDFQTPKFWEFALLNYHYEISNNEGNQNFKLSTLPKTAWFLQSLTLKVYRENVAIFLFVFTALNKKIFI